MRKNPTEPFLLDETVIVDYGGKVRIIIDANKNSFVNGHSRTFYRLLDTINLPNHEDLRNKIRILYNKKPYATSWMRKAKENGWIVPEQFDEKYFNWNKKA